MYLWILPGFLGTQKSAKQPQKGPFFLFEEPKWDKINQNLGFQFHQQQ